MRSGFGRIAHLTLSTLAAASPLQCEATVFGLEVWPLVLLLALLMGLPEEGTRLALRWRVRRGTS